MRESSSSSSSSSSFSSSGSLASPSSPGRRPFHFASSTSLVTTLSILAVPLLVISALVLTTTAPPNWFSSSSSSSSSVLPSLSSSLRSQEWESGASMASDVPVAASAAPPFINGGGGIGGDDEVVGSPGLSPSSSVDRLQLFTAPSPAPLPAPRRAKRLDPKLERLEHGLARARAAIRQSIRAANQTSALPDPDYVPRGPSYRNAYAFHRSYLEMEKLFQVYVYEEGEPPLFHDGPCKSIYSMEGRFIYNMEMETRLQTRDPDRAHVHFLPFSVVKMVKYIYQPKTFNIKSIKRTIQDYVRVISERYPYWNRSLGADHFMVSCHDWGPHASAALSNLYSNSIRVLCNANTSEGFNPAKDISLPEINLKTGLTTGIIGGPSASHRPILAFFAGGLHGPIRPLLLQHWKGKDEDVQVYEYLPSGVSYYDMMKKSRYCICPSGYEVASPRVVEAIYLECVPVIISDHYVLPFSDVLNWKAFSVQVSVRDIPNMKKILTSISPRQYIRMQRRVRTIQKHFVVNSPPQRFDVFHMILHSIWLRRMDIRIHPQD